VQSLQPGPNETDPPDVTALLLAELLADNLEHNLSRECDHLVFIAESIAPDLRAAA
jgi:hypothetical protein